MRLDGFLARDMWRTPFGPMGNKSILIKMIFALMAKLKWGGLLKILNNSENEFGKSSEPECGTQL
jgi:hypothetical protein